MSEKKSWDVFICHANEHQETVAEPLFDALDREWEIWLDKHEIKPGDSLHEKIEEGLANSRYGVVVLSNEFFDKAWTLRELNGLFHARFTSAGR